MKHINGDNRMEIRTANLEDIEQYTDLLQQTYQHAYIKESIGLTADCFSREIFNSDDTQKYLKTSLVDTANQKTWLAFDGNKLIGSVTCALENSQKAELKGFYVRKEYQGQGIGKKLYDLALEFAENRDLFLDIYTHNTKTIELYEKWGWKLDSSRGEKGYFVRHWPEWPKGLDAKCMYMKLER